MQKQTIENLPVNLKRGAQQISVFNLPSHDDIVQDGETKWQVRMNGGFVLRRGLECHPDFTDGPMDAFRFASWFNREYGNA